LIDGPGVDVVEGGDGDDRFLPSADGLSDRLLGGEGDDVITLSIGSGPDVIECGAGVDTVFQNGNTSAQVGLDCEGPFP